MAMKEQRRDGSAEKRAGDDAVEDSCGAPGGGVARRRALQLGAVAVGTAALEFDQPAAAADHDGPPRVRWARERSFDEGWLCLGGDTSDAAAPSFDDGSWRALDLPHDWSIEDLPYATSTDGGATSDPSLLVLKEPDPSAPEPPQVIGPFDTRNS
ncbi:hypothetical protein [Streptomyces mirabilis]|nr:hypothetical protein [Streptomyces mirabilis]